MGRREWINILHIELLEGDVSSIIRDMGMEVAKGKGNGKNSMRIYSGNKKLKREILKRIDWWVIKMQTALKPSPTVNIS